MPKSTSTENLQPKPDTVFFVSEYINYYISLCLVTKKKCTLKGIVNFFPIYTVLMFGYLADIVLTKLQIYDYSVHKFVIEEGLKNKQYKLGKEDKLSDFDNHSNIYSEVTLAKEKTINFIKINEKGISRSNFYVSRK